MDIVIPTSPVVHGYVTVWARLPYIHTSQHQLTVFAVSPEGRTRWPTFPELLADDGSARLAFNKDEVAAIEEAVASPSASRIATRDDRRARWVSPRGVGLRGEVPAADIGGLVEGISRRWRRSPGRRISGCERRRSSPCTSSVGCTPVALWLVIGGCSRPETSRRVA